MLEIRVIEGLAFNEFKVSRTPVAWRGGYDVICRTHPLSFSFNQ